MSVNDGLRSEVVRGLPPAGLREYADYYVGFREAGAAVRRRALPLSGVDMVLSFDGDLRFNSVRDVPAPRPPEGLTSFAWGLSDSTAVAEHAGHAHGMLVHLTPPGAALVFGVPGAELRNQVVPLETLLGGGEADALTARLRIRPGWPERFAVLDEWLHQRIAAARPLPPDVMWAWRRLTASVGQTPIVALSAELGCSRRTLALRFAETIGAMPKAYARMIRFERAQNRLRAGEDLAGIAARCGYYDQSHFNHDVRAFAGVAPGILLAERLPDGVSFGQVQLAHS